MAADLAPRQALIADGHHRYAAYRQLQARRRDAGHGTGRGTTAWRCSSTRPLTRPGSAPSTGSSRGSTPATAVELAKGAFSVRPLPGGTRDLPAALGALAGASAGGVAFLLAGGGEAYLLAEPDPVQAEAAMPPGRSPQLARPGRVGPAGTADHPGLGHQRRRATVRIVHHDAAAAISAADEAGGTAVMCSPMSAARGLRRRRERREGAAQVDVFRAQAAYRAGPAPVRPGLNSRLSEHGQRRACLASAARIKASARIAGVSGAGTASVAPTGRGPW